MRAGTYRTQDGGWIFYNRESEPWRYRSTINESPLWGVRSGSAGWSLKGIPPRFSNRQHLPLDQGALYRLTPLQFERGNPGMFYRGRFDRR